MKEKIHYVIEAALGVAVIVLFVLFFSGNRKSNFSGTTSQESSSIAGSSMPMAYISMDSLMQKYQYSIDLLEQLTRKHENSYANYGEKLRKLQSEAADFQRKIETGSFLSEERAKAEQQRLIKKQEDLQQLQAQISQDLGEEQMRLNEDLRKKIVSELKEFNKSKGYHMVFGKQADNILHADESYDITNEVIEFLNKNYTAAPEDASTTPPSAK